MSRSWNRGADEPLVAYLAFLAFCQSPPAVRSLELVAAALDPDGAEWRPRDVLEAWRRRFRWKERAAAWDADVWRQSTADAERTPLAEMTGRHQKEARALQQKLLERLRRLDPADLRPAEIIRWFDVSVRVEKETLEAKEVDDEGERRREFMDRLLADPEACDLAGRLVERLASSVAVAGGVGVVGDETRMDVGPAPGETGSTSG